MHICWRLQSGRSRAALAGGGRSRRAATSRAGGILRRTQRRGRGEGRRVSTTSSSGRPKSPACRTRRSRPRGADQSVRVAGARHESVPSGHPQGDRTGDRPRRADGVRHEGVQPSGADRDEASSSSAAAARAACPTDSIDTTRSRNWWSSASESHPMREARHHDCDRAVAPPGIEHHQSAAEGLKLVKAIDHPNFQLMIDFFHLASENEDPAIVTEAGSRLRHLHTANPQGRVFPLKWEEFDYAPFFAKLRAAGYDQRISVEASTKDFSGEAPQSITFLRRAFTPGSGGPTPVSASLGLLALAQTSPQRGTPPPATGTADRPGIGRPAAEHRSGRSADYRAGRGRARHQDLCGGVRHLPRRVGAWHGTRAQPDPVGARAQ